ncbi:MAG TPA: BTAD domain-containing putative transcriptional regulator [Trebonia sp.]|nr:BTAD domain-containing putative transcriptional regulator [Trebonia sp.]
MEFKILGPLEALAGPDRIDVGGPRQRIVIATLLLGVNQVVTTQRLIEALYGSGQPSTGRSQVQIVISALRQALARHEQPSVIRTHALGYVLELNGGRLDAERFAELVAAGRRLGRARAARDAYRDALALWRGPALDGIDSPVIRAAASLLDEQRTVVAEDCIDVELELGRHHELIGELTELTEEHPLRERLYGQLMLALYRCDRAAEALQVYRTARQRLLSELGIEPSQRLRHLEQSILTQDLALGPPAQSVRAQPPAPRAPNLLPADIGDFTGRTGHISQIKRQLSGAAQRDAMPVVVLVGKGGSGKTSLAVHVSHQLAASFPDGRLFASFHGATDHPVSPMQILERFLRVLGLPGSEMPDTLEERTEAYLSFLGDRRMLVVLDDAVTESQVIPLLPGRGGAACIVTSRQRLTGLAGAAHLDVDVLAPARSLDLLARIAGSARVELEVDQALAVASYCGHLPLALRIAGARLSARPHWSIRELADRLADETQRLDELSYGEMSVRPTISLTYENADPDAKQLFRLLALVDMPVISAWLAAALIDESVGEAEDLLDELVSDQLIEVVMPESGAPGQYRFHDLLRVFARERLAAEEPAGQQEAALERAFGGLLFLAEQARLRHWGGEYARLDSTAPRWTLPEHVVVDLISDPVEWYDRERDALVSAVEQAAQAGLTELCWNLAYNAVTLFESRSYLDDWRTTHDVALAATREAGDTRGEAAILFSLGSLHMTRQRFDLAADCFVGATRLFREVGDDRGSALVASQVAYVHRLSGRLAEAEAEYEQALAILDQTTDTIATAYVLQGLAQVRLEHGRVAEAVSLLSQALRHSRALRPGRAEAQVLYRIGESYLLSGEPEEALETFQVVLEKVRQLRDPIGETYALHGLGSAQLRQGAAEEAQRSLQGALDLARAAHDQLAEGRALLALGEAALARGDAAGAIDRGQQAAQRFRLMGALLYEARAFTMISEASSAQGDPQAAATATEMAAALRAKLASDV